MSSLRSQEGAGLPLRWGAHPRASVSSLALDLFSHLPRDANGRGEKEMSGSVSGEV